MSSWLPFLGAKKDTRSTARDAIVGLRQHLAVLDKKEENLNRKIEEELKKAKANAVGNKSVATAALRRKRLHETELDKLQGTRLTLETQLNAIENASFNNETMQAMKQGAGALKNIHAGLNIDKVDATMDSIREQMEVANEISEAISNPVGMGPVIDEDELRADLEELEQEELNDRLMGADRVPVHSPSYSTSVKSDVGKAKAPTHEEDEEERELRELQAALAM